MTAKVVYHREKWQDEIDCLQQENVSKFNQILSNKPKILTIWIKMYAKETIVRVYQYN